MDNSLIINTAVFKDKILKNVRFDFMLTVSTLKSPAGTPASTIQQKLVFSTQLFFYYNVK